MIGSHHDPTIISQPCEVTLMLSGVKLVELEDGFR